MWILSVFVLFFAMNTVQSACQVNITDRAGWQAKNIVSKATDLIPASNLPVKLVFIHHTAGGNWYSFFKEPGFEPRCFTKEECIKKVQRVERKHLEERDYDDIGYNYLVGEDGNAYEGRGWRKVGAHTYGYNTFSIAICVLGNFVDDKPDVKALNAIQGLLDCAIDDGVLSPDYELFGHRDTADTECPGQQLYNQISLWPKFSTRVMQRYESSFFGKKHAVPLPLPCQAYGDIRELKATGAKSATAVAGGLHFGGKPASDRFIDQDISELEAHRSCFVKVGKEYGIHPALIGALASRVTKAGKTLTAQGYGEDASKYGFMQCDTTSPVYGSRCTQYGPMSCEHIQMMIDDKLVPDIRTAMKKYSFDKEEKGQRVGIAAYEHTVKEVQSWPAPDSKTNGGDFSNDVIARAHRLIHHHKWTCEGTSPSPHLPGTGPGTSVPTPGADHCKARADRGDCNFYIECVDKVVPCTDEGYALGYGYKYCNRFSQFFDDFTTEGKTWINAVRICLMKALLPHVAKGKTCTQIANVAFDTHVKCYLDSGPGICNVAPLNMANLWKVYEIKDFFGKYAWKAWKQVLATIASCPGKAYEEGKAFLKDINRQINAWERSLIDEAIQNAINRGKRSTECEQYAQSGDCRFYECFEAKFACAAHNGYSHIQDFEMTLCTNFQILSSSDNEVGAWMTRTQHCLMNHLMALYNQDSLDCEIVELHMLEGRVSCMVDAGFCALDRRNEWMIERGTNMKGYPHIAPVGYTTLPESHKTIQIKDYFYQTLVWFKIQIGLANEKCYESGHRESNDMYKYVDTARYGMLKIRTEL